MVIFAFMKLNRITLAVCSALALASCGSQQKTSKNTTYRKPATTQAAPKAPAKPVAKVVEAEDLSHLQLLEANREFRGAWVATVANINWPTRNSLSTEKQKEEAIELLDMLKDANFNAVIFQARPSADALYKSDLEPWSYFLTGQNGRAPEPFYDPLEFWISEAHKRGMELHVWLNPYRAHHTSGGPVSETSTARKFAAETYRLRNGMYWMDPADKKVQDHVSAVVKDLVKRYDLDAVHIDDYFYPYREYNGGADFPDSRSWNTYRNSGGTLSRADWRRASVNQFIKRLHEEIKAEKSWVKFGISPFGIWKPGYPAGITGSSQYDDLFADAKLWLNEGWCDYFSPQLYWKEGGPQSFSALLAWWQQENYRKIHLWPGLNTVGVKSSDRPSEITGQIRTTRELLKNGAGEIHYSTSGISKSPEMFSSLKTIYQEKALVPASPWLKKQDVLKPEINARKKGNTVETEWLSRIPEQPRHWLLYTKYGERWEIQILDGVQKTLALPLSKSGNPLKIIALKSVDRLGIESEYAAVKVQ